MRYAPILVAVMLAGLVAWPFVRNMTGTEPQGMPGARIGGHFTLETITGPLDTATLDSDLKMIFFGFTYCPDVCPVELAKAAQVMQSLGDDAERVSVIFVTVDPRRDTAEAVNAYAKAFDPRFIGVTGGDERIRDVMRQYQVYAQKVGEGVNYTVDHTSRTYVVDRDAKLMALFAMDTEVPAMVEQIRRFL